MKTQFKEKDTIHYMDENKPKSGVITGITMKIGKGEGLHDKFEIPKGEIEVIYHVSGNWYGIKDTNAYKSVEALQTAVFEVEVVAEPQA